MPDVLNIIGPGNAIFLVHDSNLKLHIFGQENATFLGDSCYYRLTSCNGYHMYWTCFKMTMCPPNIMTFWHNMLHDITGWMQKKLELMNINWQVDNFSKFIKGKHGFYEGGKTEKFEIPFLLEKFTNIGPEYTKRYRIATFGGSMFPKKSWFCQLFYEIIMILNFLDYNRAPF